MTSGARPYDRAQLADGLAMLSAKTVACKAELESWSSLAHTVRERLLAGAAAALGVLPTSLWDYLADAEIRLSGPDYAAAQQRIIGHLIERLRRESELARVAFG